MAQLSDTREQQQKAIRTCVAFPSPKARKSPVLRNRIQNQAQQSVTKSKASLCRAQLITLSSHLWSLGWLHQQNYLHLPYWSFFAPHSCLYSINVFIPRYTKKIGHVAPMRPLKCKTNKQQKLRSDDFILNQCTQLLQIGEI